MNVALQAGGVWHQLQHHLDIRSLGGQAAVSYTHLFYMPNPEDLDVWKKYGVLAVEMEACALYTRAAEYGAQALALLTVSNHIYTGVELTPKERERTLDEMIQVALHAFIGID